MARYSANPAALGHQHIKKCIVHACKVHMVIVDGIGIRLLRFHISKHGIMSYAEGRIGQENINGTLPDVKPTVE